MGTTEDEVNAKLQELSREVARLAGEKRQGKRWDEVAVGFTYRHIGEAIERAGGDGEDCGLAGLVASALAQRLWTDREQLVAECLAELDNETGGELNIYPGDVAARDSY